jgi:hypothetical protein
MFCVLKLQSAFSVMGVQSSVLKYALILFGICELCPRLQLEGIFAVFPNDHKKKTQEPTQIRLIVSGRRLCSDELPAGLCRVSMGACPDEVIVELKSGVKKVWKLGERLDLGLDEEGID